MNDQRPLDRYVEVRNIRTRYWALGAGEPCAILVHGLGGYVENWEPNIAALAQGRRVYALDLVGFGRTDKPAVTYSLPYLAEFVHDFMAVKGIRNAALIGESLGGAIALRFALQYPDQVEKLVLADSAGLGREISIYLRIPTLPIVGEWFTRPSRQGSAQALRQLFHDPNLVTDRRIEEDFELSLLPGAQSSLLNTLRTLADLRGCKDETYRPVLDRAQEIRMPTLVIWGAQDRILPIAQARRAVKILPNAMLHIFDPCGHVPNIECPEDFNRLVTDFLSDGRPHTTA